MRMLGRRQDDRGSMPVALLLIMVGASLSAVIAASLATRTLSARDTMQRPRLLAAAQAGFDVAVGHIRAAVDNAGNGLRTALPCGPYSGTTDVGTGSATSYTYTVTITYKTIGNSVITCTPNSGTLTVPVYADLASTATNPVTLARRSLTSRYTVRTTNKNIPGGLVRTADTNLVAGSILCFDAGSATPAVGAPLRLQTCTSGSQQQTFAYTELLELSLVSSATDAMPRGLCADGGAVPHPSTNVTVTMQPCLSVSPAPQQWSLDDHNFFQGTSDGVNLDGHCLYPQNLAVGTPVVVRNGCGFGYNPDASVGAGAAGAATKQVVNYAEFGRCLDVAQYDWHRSFFWVWPCKQAPSPSGVSWNQKWDLPTIVSGSTSASGFIINWPPAISPSPACLKSPSSNAPDSYVTLTDVGCSSGTASGSLKWTVYGDTGVYATSYTIVDFLGNCLTAKDPSVAGGTVNFGGDDVSPAVTLACDGSTLQKWNADPNVLKASPLTLFNEP